MDRADYTFYSQNTRGYRLTIFSQLRQAIETMHNAEEVFQWLASVIMQRFDMPIVQLWSYENNRSTQSAAQLLAMASQNPAQPLHVINEKVAMAVEHISKGQHVSYPQPVEQLFPLYVASLLKRYSLNFCAYCVIDRNLQSISPDYPLSHEKTTMGFTCIALLFLWRNVDQNLISTISAILEQAMVITESHHLLLPDTTNSYRLSLPEETLSLETPPALNVLIPRRKQNEGLMLSSNPFASPLNIPDKQALRLYEAIDNHKNVTELCRSVGINLKEAQAALQTLLRLQQIEMYTMEGWPVDSTLLFNYR